jgi:Leucine-rich repeat (LRR) protein
LDFSQRNIVGELIFENVPKVKFLTVGNNQLTSLKISNCPNLHTIVASHNQLTCLQVENCEKMKRVFASWNCLKELNLDHLSLEVLTYDNDKTEELNAKMEAPSK